MRRKKSIFNQLHVQSGRSIVNVLLILICLWVFARPLRHVGESIYSNTGGVTSNIFQTIPESKRNIESLLKSKETAELQSKKLSVLKIKNRILENEIEEAIRLKRILNLKSDLKFRSLAASVIGRSADNWHKQLILDKGKNHNIKVGNSVLSSEGVVGQVVEVNKKTSIAELISDPSFRIGCSIEDKDIFGILYGMSNNVGLIHYVPVGTQIKVGDKVVTSGISAEDMYPTYPTGHTIGTVSKVSKKKSMSSDLYIEVKLAENLNAIKNVIIFSPG